MNNKLLPKHRFTTLSMHSKGNYKVHLCENHIDSNNCISGFIVSSDEYHCRMDATIAQQNANKRCALHNAKITAAAAVKKPAKKQ